MEYIYAALTIHKAGGKIDEQTVSKVLNAAGAEADEARIKALVAALDGVDIDDAVSKAAAAPAVAQAAPAAGSEAPAQGADEKAEEKEEEKNEEEAAAGLGALFG